MTHQPTESRQRVHRAATVAVAALAALVAHVLITATGVDLVVGDSARRSVTGGAVLGAGLVAGLLGWALLAALERSTRRPGRTWSYVAVVTLALSLGGPVTSGASGSALLGLLTLHLVVGGLLIALLPRTSTSTALASPSRRDPDPEGAAHSLQ